MPGRFSAARRRLLFTPVVATGLLIANALPGAAALDVQIGFPAGRGTGGAQRMVVVLADSVSDPADVAAEQAAVFESSVEQVFVHGMPGWSGMLDRSDLRAARRDPRVRMVEPDVTFHTADTQTENVPWGLDRIDQTDLPVDSRFTSLSRGAGVTAYVVDSGIRFSHSEFAGRAVPGFDYTGGAGGDCNGHGTHVAGTLGGATYGVAKDVSLVSVRVFDCRGSGTTSSILAGLDWIVAHHQVGAPAVANMSFGGGSTSKALDAAVARVIDDGITVAVSAGNSKKKACKASPARVPAAITVGASDQSDRRASFSNYGDCVDLFAPGVNVLSADASSDSAARFLSGTSMSAPHVAGVAALLLQNVPAATPTAVASALGDLTTRGKVTKAKTDRDDLLFTNL